MASTLFVDMVHLEDTAIQPCEVSQRVSSAASLQVADFDNSVQRALLLREGDWVESEAMTSLAVSLGEPAAASATEQLAAHRAQRPLPPTAQEVNFPPPPPSCCSLKGGEK